MRYKILLNGQNLLTEVEGRLQYLGFYTTRIVEASSETEARSLALALIRQDKKLLQIIRNETVDPPTFSVEEIEEIEELGGESAPPQVGFCFYYETSM